MLLAFSMFDLVSAVIVFFSDLVRNMNLLCYGDIDHLEALVTFLAIPLEEKTPDASN